MQNIENIIKALECCRGERQCDTCPYNSHGADDCDDRLLFDAERLLKQQRPRTLTLDEAKEVLRNDPVIWIQTKDDIVRGIRMRGENYFTMETDEVLDITDLDDPAVADAYGTKLWLLNGEPR